MSFIEITEPKQATGQLKEIYSDIKKSRGKIAQVHTIQSLNPESITAHMDLYMTVMFGKSPLKRAQREMMAVVVSSANHCEYCQLHHGEALNQYWKDRKKVEKLSKDYRKLDLNNVDNHLCKLAQKLTESPDQINEEKDITPLKKAGLSDRAILDAVLVISYFNFVNRMILGLGVETDEQEVRGYYY